MPAEIVLETRWVGAGRGGEPTLTNQQTAESKSQVPGWHVKVVDGVKRLERIFKFKNFVESLEFTNKIGAISAVEGHHPLIVTEYGRVTVNW